MNRLINEFSVFLENVQRVSRNTLLSYCSDTELFFAKMGINNREDCLKINNEQLREYFRSMSAEGKAEATVLRSAASIRSFYAYLEQAGLITHSPAEELKLPRPSKKTPAVLSPGEINRIISLPCVSEPKGLRDKAMLELLYATGIKVSELISLELRDIDLAHGSIVCRSGDKQRVIPVGASAEKALHDYICGVRKDMIENTGVKALFVNCHGKAMTRQGIWKIIKSYIDDAGIKKPVTPQILRHSFAVHLLQNGADYRDVSEMMGYNDELSAKVYSDMVNDRIKRTYNRAHPRA